MHAVTWPSARAARRIPAQLIAGRRFPLRTRAFYRSARLNSSGGSPSEPRDPHTPAVAEHDNEKPAQPANGLPPTGDHNQHDVGAEIAAEAAGESPTVLAEKLRKSKERTRFYQSALKRTARIKQSEDFPPIEIPPRFLARNVTIREERTAESKPAQCDDFGYPSGRGPPKPDAKGNLCLSWLDGDKPDVYETAKLSLPLPERLYQILESTAAENGKAEELPGYEDVLEFVERVYAPGDPSKQSPLEDNTSLDNTLHFSIYLEVLAAIAGSLASAKPELASSFPAGKSTLVLHSPLEGGITRLDQLVEDVAAHLQADLIKLDSQDIAELVGDYLGEGTDPHSMSLRSLGYETHRSSSEAFDLEEDEYDDFEAEEEAEEGQEDPAADSRTAPAPKGRKGGPPFVIQGVHAMEFGDLFKAMSGPARGSSGRSAAMGAADFLPGQLGRDASPETARWNDMKLGAYLDALLDTTSTKRKDLEEAQRTESNEGAAAPESHDSSPVPSTEPLVIGQRGPYRLTFEKSALQKPQSPSTQRTILLIKDYKELTATRQGARILDKISELVHSRRKDGSEIMIVGATSSSELVPEISRSAIRSLQAENEETLSRTIVVPLGATSLRPSIDVQKSLASETLKRTAKDITSESPGDFVTAERRRNEQINSRHIQDMIRRLDPGAKDDEKPMPPLHKSSIPFPGIDWRSRVLAFHEVHRLVQTAIGLQRAAGESSRLGQDLVVLAGLLLRMSDDVKFSWVAHERQKNRESKDTVADASKTPADTRLEKVQKTADKHEKKLLNGVVNPSNIKTTFADVHATPDTIDALKTMTSLSLLRPDAFSYGVLATDKIPGLLLYGPPGTGKTLLAKAVAKESGATVLEVSGSEVYDMYVGEGEKNVRAIFSLARKLSPCVVFIDEADAIFGNRSDSRHRTSHREVLNQFLKEWDGMNDLSVFIMVATNRPFDMDDAVLRRLPRRLLVDLPTQKDREEILRIHLKDEQLDEDVRLDMLAAKTPFYSGSDLKNLCVAAALNCVREENDIVAAIRAHEEADTFQASAANEEGKSSNEAVDGEQQAAEAANETPEHNAAVDGDQPSSSAKSSGDAATTSKSLLENIIAKAEAVLSADASSPSSSPAPPSSSPTTPTTTTSTPSSSSTPSSPAPSLFLSLSSSSPASPYPEKRTLLPHHFDKAMQEISASISEDMASLTAIRKFDEQYGDKRSKRKKKSSWGFAVAEDVGPGEEAARVRPSMRSAGASSARR